MKNLFKYLVGIIISIIFRLIPAPNVEPIMSTMMPYAKKWGVLAGILFTFSAMLMFDLITGTLGVWSLLTISAYLIVALFAGIYFKNRGKVKHYVIFAIIGTLFYDAVTSISVGVFVFNQSLMQTLILQIPFTLIHLLSNIVLAALVSPLLYKWILRNPKWETSKVILYFKNVFRG